MHILVVNCGSSSIRAGIISFPEKTLSAKLKVERIGIRAEANINGKKIETGESEEFAQVLTHTLKAFVAGWDGHIDGIGHRVVHGGSKYSQPVFIDEEVKTTIREMIPLAPLHNPNNLLGIEVCEELFPQQPQIAVFDTAFHRTLPRRAQYYAIDKDLSDEKQLLRYGFHGTSHHFVSRAAADYLKQDVRELKIITCHLGNGSSMAAVEYGRSIETSMGMSALEGLMMGTRSGDLDPGILSYLMGEEGYTKEKIDDLLYNNSGLLGVSGLTSDMREIIESAEQGNDRARLALQIYTHRVRKYIGAYAAAMGGVDVIAFTAGIGENSAVVRHRTLQRFDFLGAIFDEDLNRDIQLSAAEPVGEFSAPNSRVKLLAIHTDEQLAIAERAKEMISEAYKITSTERKIPIAISARHVHLRQETVEQLFGKGHQLTPYRDLSQPGQYACEEMVTLVGPKNKIERVRILGPVRSYDQVEISRTDEFFLGVDAPVRESGHIEGSPGITLTTDYGTATLKEGLICALRHIHMHPDDANYFGVKDQDVVEVDIENEVRPITFKNVLIRVSENFKLEMHIDTDEGNAAEINNGEHSGQIITLTGSTGKILTKKV